MRIRNKVTGRYRWRAWGICLKWTWCYRKVSTWMIPWNDFLILKKVIFILKSYFFLISIAFLYIYIYNSNYWHKKFIFLYQNITKEIFKTAPHLDWQRIAPSIQKRVIQRSPWFSTDSIDKAVKTTEFKCPS